MYFFCIIAYISVVRRTCPNIKRRFVYYLYKFIAIFKRTRANRSYAIRDNNACKACAILERILANRGYAIRYSHACKAWAIIECTKKNFSSRNSYRFKRGRDIIGCVCSAACTWTVIILTCCNTAGIAWRTEYISERILIGVTWSFSASANKRQSYAFKAWATTERRLANRGYAVWDNNACKAIAIRERIIIDFVTFSVIAFGKDKLGIFSYISKKIIYSVIAIEKIIILIYYFTLSRVYFYCIIAYISVIFRTCHNIKRRFVYYFDKFIAIRERTTANCGYAIRDYNAGKACAFIECALANYSYAISNFNACKAMAIGERTFANWSYAIRDYNARKVITRRERRFANCGHAIRDYNACKACTIAERPSANLGYAIRNNKACVFFSYCILNKCFTVFGVKISVYILICRIIFIYGNARKVIAITKRTFANWGYAIRYYNACEACAATERSLATCCYAIRDFNACKACAIPERISANPGYTT